MKEKIAAVIVVIVLVIVIALIGAVIAVTARADVTDFTHHLKRQGVNKYKLTRPDINTYNHINITTDMVKRAAKFIITPRNKAHKEGTKVVGRVGRF